jgi:hypothetical protein
LGEIHAVVDPLEKKISLREKSHADSHRLRAAAALTGFGELALGRRMSLKHPPWRHRVTFLLLRA